MAKRETIFAASAVATFIGAIATSIAFSGEFSPAIIAIAVGVSSGCSALTAFLSRPKGLSGE